MRKDLFQGESDRCYKKKGGWPWFSIRVAMSLVVSVDLDHLCVEGPSRGSSVWWVPKGSKNLPNILIASKGENHFSWESNILISYNGIKDSSKGFNILISTKGGKDFS